MIEFDLKDTEFIPLCDLLKATGICENGGQAKLFIQEGLVRVNGEIEYRKRHKVRSGFEIIFEDQKIVVK